MTKVNKRMCTEQINKLVLSIAVPASISLIITSLFSVIDMLFVAGLGVRETAAVGITFTIVAVIQAVGFTIGMGAGTLISVSLGAGKKDEAGNTLSVALLCGVIIGLVISVCGNIWINNILEMIGGSPDSIASGKGYARVVLISAVPMICAFILNNTLRAEGKAAYAMLITVTSGIINIILEPILIYKTSLGVTGAAVAMFIGQIINSAGMAVLYLRKKTETRFRIKNCIINISGIRQIIIYGMPGLFRQGLAGIAAAFISRQALSSGGDAAVSAMSINNKLYMIIFSAVIGIGQALATITGFGYGGGYEKRIKEAYKYCVSRGIAIMMIAGIILYLIAPEIVIIFTKSQPETKDMAVSALRAQSIVFPFMVVPVMNNMVYQGMKQNVKSTIVASMRQGIFLLPMLFILPYLLGMNGVITAQPAADVLTGITMIAIQILRAYFSSHRESIL